MQFVAFEQRKSSNVKRVHTRRVRIGFPNFRLNTLLQRYVSKDPERALFHLFFKVTDNLASTWTAGDAIAALWLPRFLQPYPPVESLKDFYSVSFEVSSELDDVQSLLVSCAYEYFYQQCPIRRLEFEEFEEFAFTRIGSTKIHDSEVLASIRTTFNARAFVNWSVSSVYEKWIGVIVSKSSQSTLAAINSLAF